MTSRGKLWLVVALVSAGGCCLTGAAVLALAAAGGDGEVAAPAGSGGAVGDGDDDEQGVLFTTAQGTFVAEAQVVQRRAGLPQPPEGVWKEDRRNIALRLTADGDYTLRYQASGPSGGVGYAEDGRWQGDGARLVLSPSRLRRSSAFVFSDTPGVRVHGETEELAVGPPRAYQVEAAVVRYVANWADPAPVAQKEGMVLQGPPPPEAWTGGEPWQLVLRRARLMPPGD